MGYTADEFKNVAMVNKSNLMKKAFIVPIANNKYQFKIAGVGQMSIKIEKFFYYSEIIKAVQKGIDDGLEYLVEQIIIDPNMEKIPNLDSYQELKLRAFANKQALKRMSIESFVGTKKYEFRIAGIGGRAIKLELYVGYEDIAKELNEGNEVNLEFILKEILVDNEVDYSIFENINIETLDYEENIESDDDQEEPEKVISINKLSLNECKNIISKIEGIQRLIFDSIDGIDSDVFSMDDVLEQDLIKSYAVKGKSFEPIITKNIEELIELGIITKGDNNNYYKLW